MLVLKWGWPGPVGEAGGADCITAHLPRLPTAVPFGSHADFGLPELSTNLRTSH